MDPKDERSNKTKAAKKVNFGPFSRSKVTRLTYVLYITIIIFICMIILSPQIVGFFQRIFCRDFNYYYCDLLVGYDAVYRLGSAFAIWFIILAFATLGITSSTEERAKVQNSYWVVKTTGLIFLEILFVLIPHNEYNGEIWLFIGLNAAFCFIILQYTFILDAANLFCILFEAISDNIHSQFSDLTINLFRTAKTFTTVFLYSVSLITSVGFYFMYGSYYECLDNFVFISFNLIMCFASSVISLLPIVRDACPQMGLFQCAVTSLYCTYVMWLALSSEPRTKCNPSDVISFPGSPMANIQVWVTIFITFSTLVYISTRDLVAPQFGKVEKTVQNSLKLAYNLQENREEISQPSSPKGNTKNANLCTSPKTFDKHVSHLDGSGNLKLACNLQGDENKLKDNLNKVNAFSSSKSPSENNKECRLQSKEPELNVNSYSLDTDSSHLKTTKQVSSVNSTKTDATIEPESGSLAWDNTLFSCAKTNRTSASYKPLANRATAIESSNCTRTGTPASLTLTETKRIANRTVDCAGRKDIYATPKTHSSKSPSIESSNFTSTGTLESLTLIEAKHIAEGNFDSTGMNDISATHKTCSSKSSSIENSNLTRTSTEEASTLIEVKHHAEGAFANLGSRKILTNTSKSPSLESRNFTTTGTKEALKLTAPPKSETRPLFETDFPVDSMEKHVSCGSPKCLTNPSDSPLTESSGFATKGIPESLSLIALREERDTLFGKCLTKTTREHFTITNPKSNHSKSPLLECNNPTANETPTKGADSGALIWDDEVEGIEYSYPFFHLTFSLASLYLIMSITNWYRLDEGEHLTVRLVQSWSAVWLRISASIFCSFILIWSMIIPVLFPDTYNHLLFFQYLTSSSQ